MVSVDTVGNSLQTNLNKIYRNTWVGSQYYNAGVLRTCGDFYWYFSFSAVTRMILNSFAAQDTEKWCPFNITSEFYSHFVCKSIWLGRIKICSSFGQFLLPQALFHKKNCAHFYFQASILANIYLFKCSSGNTRKRLKYVNNKDSSLWCRYSYLCTYFTPFSSVSFDYFEQINVFLACLKKATGSQCGLYQMFKTKRSEKALLLRIL